MAKTNFPRRTTKSLRVRPQPASYSRRLSSLHQTRISRPTTLLIVRAEAVLPEGFETEKAAALEDKRRAHWMRRVLNRPGPTTWLNMGDRCWLWAQRLPRVRAPALDRKAVANLATRLERGVATEITARTLASSLWMRDLRQGLLEVLHDAFADYPDDELRTVTVIYKGWSLTPAELETVTAAQIKKQFRQHLDRVGVTKVPGPLFAVAHGEFEPRSGRYQLHFHIVTTAAKAAALKAGLKAKSIKGYTATATGGSPVRQSQIGNRVTQFSYIAKAFWPCRPVVSVNGKPKRVRDPGRIPEPFHTQVLLWLDRQRFSEMVVMHDCWSRRNGGSAAMKRLYSFVMEAG